jgi:hypothetical protein
MTRRWFFTTPLFGLTRAWGATDFWNRKPAKEWTDQDIRQLITKSPWAQEARADPKRDVTSPVPETAQSAGGPDKPVIGARAATVTVCWDSARPVLDALGNFLPPGFGAHYVIGVNDPGREIEPLKSSSALSAKGKEPVQAGAIVRGRDGVTVFFGFSKDLLPLTVRDKDVLFALDTDRFALRAKFDPKEMVYRGELAL